MFSFSSILGKAYVHIGVLKPSYNMWEYMYLLTQVNGYNMSSVNRTCQFMCEVDLARTSRWANSKQDAEYHYEIIELPDN